MIYTLIYVNTKETKDGCKLLIDNDMLKKDLQNTAGISRAIVTEMSKGEIVSTEVLMRIYKMFHCNVRDIVDFVETADETGKVKRHGGIRCQKHKTQVPTKALDN